MNSLPVPNRYSGSERIEQLLNDPTHSGPFILAVDLGTGGPKVAVVSVNGRIAGWAQEKNDLILLPSGGVEQDPEQWWTSIVTASRDAISRSGVPPSSIVAVAMSTQWMGTVPVGADGRHLANALIWMDSRGARHVEKIVGGGLEVPGTGYNARRLRKWLALTGGLPSRTGKDPVGHIAFLRNERPEIYSAAAYFLEPMDYLNLRLTGTVAASFDTITGYWCTDNRDLDRVAYVEELIDWAQLDPDKLPPLRPTGSILGSVTQEAAAELGIPPGVQVVTGTGDTAAAAVGSGAVADGAAHLYIGTSSWISCHVPYKKTDIFSSITSLPSGIPGRYWTATEQDVAGKAMSWLVEQVLWPDDGLGGPPPPDALDQLNKLAGSVPPGSGGTIFTPWLNGERTPVDDHWIRGGWLNVSLSTERAHLVRSVFEGVALNSRWMFEAVKKFVKDPVAELAFVGGGAQSDLWCSIHADVLGVRIHQVDEPVLANARGAALRASVALGHLRWEDVPSAVAVRNTFEPDTRNKETYDRLFDGFRATYKGTRRMYAKFNRSLDRGENQ